VWSVAVSLDGKLVASGSVGGTLCIWDSHTSACPLGPIAAHSDVIRSVAFSPDGSRIVTGSRDGTVKVWNVATGGLCLGPLTGHTEDVMSVAFSPDGMHCVRIERSNNSHLGCEHREISHGTIGGAYR